MRHQATVKIGLNYLKPRNKIMLIELMAIVLPELCALKATVAVAAKYLQPTSGRARSVRLPE